MGTRADQDGGFFGELVDEEPVSAEVAFPVFLEVPGELVIAVVGWKGFALGQEIDDLTQAHDVASCAFDPINVFLETFLEDNLAHQRPSADFASFAVL